MCTTCTSASDLIEVMAPKNYAAPNILLITADDMGMADLGSFGSEIETPNLDSLAYMGVWLSNFHVAPTCSPTRAMLLTGLDSHLVGLGSMAEDLAPNQVGMPGYEGHINDRTPTIAERLREKGYNTYLTGKWHLGMSPESVPSSQGFGKTFSMLSGGASHYPDMKPAYAPSPEVKAPYYENGEKLAELPPDFKYSSQFYADKLIEFIKADRNSNKPFFGYLSFTAPHWPLQAPEQAIKKHEGRYEDGYEVLASNRFSKQVELGILPKNAKLNRLDENSAPSWSSLSTLEKRFSAKAMEIYAAMVQEMDIEVGKVIRFLRQEGVLDNTIVIFMSDNGAEGHTLDETFPANLYPKIRATINEAHDFSYEAMGASGSYAFYDAGWARAGAPGFRLHKGFPTEGGTRVPAFVYFSGMERAGEVDAQQYHVKDIVPTIMDFVAGGDGEWNVNESSASELTLTGLSMRPYLENSSLKLAPRIEVFELFGKISVREYPWKLVFHRQPWGKDDWQLYNLEDDLLESKDLASSEPDIVERLQGHWRDYEREMGLFFQIMSAVIECQTF